MHSSKHYKAGNKIRQVIEIFYHPFRHLCPKQIFVYGVCGGGNLVFGWILFWAIYNLILRKSGIDLGFYALKSHTATFFLQFPLTFFSGFWLNRYVSFSESELKKRVQLPRYLSVVVLCIVINLICLKLFVEQLGLYPTPSQVLATGITTIISFLAQKYYAFRVKKH